MCTRIWNPQSLTRLSVTISRLAKNKDVPWRDMGWGMGNGKDMGYGTVLQTDLGLKRVWQRVTIQRNKHGTQHNTGNTHWQTLQLDSQRLAYFFLFFRSYREGQTHLDTRIQVSFSLFGYFAFSTVFPLLLFFVFFRCCCLLNVLYFWAKEWAGE